MILKLVKLPFSLYALKYKKVKLMVAKLGVNNLIPIGVGPLDAYKAILNPQVREQPEMFRDFQRREPWEGDILRGGATHP